MQILEHVLVTPRGRLGFRVSLAFPAFPITALLGVDGAGLLLMQLQRW